MVYLVCVSDICMQATVQRVPCHFHTEVECWEGGCCWDATAGECYSREAGTRWRHQMETFPRYWPFVRVIHWSSVDSRHKDQWRGALMFSLMYAWTNGWGYIPDAGDLKSQGAYYDVIEMNSNKLEFELEKYLFDNKTDTTWHNFYVWMPLQRRWAHHTDVKTLFKHTFNVIFTLTTIQCTQRCAIIKFV